MADPAEIARPVPERIIVCGGRDYRDRATVYAVLDEYRETAGAIMCGGAPGADSLAWDWGWSRNFHVERYMADWRTHGRAAGPIRNQKMLEESRPTLVIAFPGGRGTDDMVRRAVQAGVKVRAIVEQGGGA